MAYTPTNWENLPSTNTPINETNLNKMEGGIAGSVSKNGDTVDGDIILDNAHYLKGIDANDNEMFLIRAVNNMVAIGDETKETRIWASAMPTVRVGNNTYTLKSTADDNIITAGGASSVTASTTGEVQIPITRAIEQVGNKFTISNNRIYIGTGISKVLVSAAVYCNLAANRGGVFNISLRKNGNRINGQINAGYGSTSSRNACLALAPKLVSVNQGDYFDYTVYLYNGDVLRSDDNNLTFLTIQAVS